MYISSVLLTWRSSPLGLTSTLLTFFTVSRKGCTPVSTLGDVAERQFGESLAQRSVNPDTIIIAVDATGSMKGFAGTSSYQDLIRKTITALGASANVKYYWFDTIPHQVGNFLQLFNPALFTKQATNLQKAFRIKESSRNATLIVITDFQFNTDQDYFDLVKLFQREIGEGTYIKIFSARPDFYGEIFPQFNNHPRYKYSGPRPLYAIAIGERKHASFIEDVLGKALVWENSLTLTGENPAEWKIHHPSANVRINGRSLILTSRDSISFRLRLNSPTISEWGEWNQNEIHSEAYTYHDSVFVKSEENLIVRNVETLGDTCTVTFSAKEANPIPPRLWRVSMRPDSVPSWISSQSCHPDGNQARMTVRIKEFIEDVVRPIIPPFSVVTVNVFLYQDE